MSEDLVPNITGSY